MSEQQFYQEIAKQHAIEDFISSESSWIDEETIILKE